MVRIKNRYLLGTIIYPELDENLASSQVSDLLSLHQPTTNDLTPQVLLKAIRLEVANLFGDYGSGAIGDSLAVKYLSPATSTFIVRVSRAHYRVVWAALSMMNTVPVKNGKRCIIRVLRVSGTVKKAEEAAVRRAREMIVKARQELGNKSGSLLEEMFKNDESNAMPGSTEDLLGVDGTDDEDEDMTDGGN